MPKSSAGSARASKAPESANPVKRVAKKTAKKATKNVPTKTVKKAVKKVAKKAVEEAVKKAVKKTVVKKAATRTAGTTTKKLAAAPVGTMPEVGAKAPGFRLPDETGAMRSLSDFSGKTLVVYFYPKDDTPGCTQESCDFRDNLNRLTTAGAAVVGVSADSVESHRKFKTKHGLNFPLLSDPEHAMLSAYGVWQEKSLYGRKFMGIVRSTFVLDGAGRVRAVFSPVKVTGHVDAVLDAIAKTGGRA